MAVCQEPRADSHCNCAENQEFIADNQGGENHEGHAAQGDGDAGGEAADDGFEGEPEDGGQAENEEAEAHPDYAFQAGKFGGKLAGCIFLCGTEFCGGVGLFALGDGDRGADDGRMGVCEWGAGGRGVDLGFFDAGAGREGVGASFDGVLGLAARLGGVIALGEGLLQGAGGFWSGGGSLPPLRGLVAEQPEMRAAASARMVGGNEPLLALDFLISIIFFTSPCMGVQNAFTRVQNVYAVNLDFVRELGERRVEGGRCLRGKPLGLFRGWLAQVASRPIGFCALRCRGFECRAKNVFVSSLHGANAICRHVHASCYHGH